MITGIGTDIVDLQKAKYLWTRYGSRLKGDLLTPTEYDRLISLRDNTSTGEDLPGGRVTKFLASRLAAKEAAVKALGAPHMVTYNWSDIEVIGDFHIDIRVDERLKWLADSINCSRLTGSVQNNGRFCLAIVIGETE